MGDDMLQQMLMDYSKVRDDYGFVQPDGKTSSNGIRFTSEFVMALHRRGILPTNVSLRLELTKLFAQCEMLPGLLRRHPSKPAEQEGPDDYVAALAASAILHNGFAGRFLEYGRRNHFVFNNVSPRVFTWSAYLGRQRQLVAHAYFANGEQPWIWDKLWWIATILISAHGDKDDQDNWALSWFLIKTEYKKSFICDIAARYWVKRFKKHWPGGIGAVLGEYFNNPKHPSVKWLNMEYGINE